MKKIFLLILLLVVGFSNVNGQTYTGMAFYDNGEPKVIKTYKVSKDKIELVKEVGWHENGQKKAEETYNKDGELDGKLTRWYENGQKSKEGTYRDGLPDGFWTTWYDNGQKRSEGTYKGKKAISEKVWNKDGSVKE